MKNYFSTGDLIVIFLTALFFILALFAHGLTHDLLLEAGVLLVSIKLIMMNYKNIQSNNAIQTQLNDIKKTLEEIKKKS